MLPIEFTFEGPPLSLRSKSSTRKRAYKSRVESEARAVWPTGYTPVTGQVNIVITYYYEGDTPDIGTTKDN